MNNGNRILVINSYELMMTHWEFLLSGLETIQKEAGANGPCVGGDEFFKTMLSIATSGDRGSILILTSKNLKPLGYIALAENTAMFQPKTVCIYCFYSNNRCPSALSELAYEAKVWAQKNMFKRVQACSYRISGGTRKFFEKRFGLRQRFLVFETELC